jgi:hypothetical protein
VSKSKGQRRCTAGGGAGGDVGSARRRRPWSMLGFGGIDGGGALVTFSAIEEFGGRGRWGTSGGRWCGGVAGQQRAGPEEVEEEEAAIDRIVQRKTKPLIDSCGGRGSHITSGGRSQRGVTTSPDRGTPFSLT